MPCRAVRALFRPSRLLLVLLWPALRLLHDLLARLGSRPLMAERSDLVPTGPRSGGTCLRGLPPQRLVIRATQIVHARERRLHRRLDASYGGLPLLIWDQAG